MPEPEFPGEMIYPEQPYEGTDHRPPKPDFVRRDEQGWQVRDSGRWRPDDAGEF